MPPHAEDAVPTEWPTDGDPATALLDELEDVLEVDATPPRPG